MTIVEDNGSIQPDALAAFEAIIGRLPDDYRDFISAHNGVVLSGIAEVRVNTPGGAEYWGIETIEGIKDDMGAEGVALHTEFWGEDLPKGAIPVATDGTGNTYLMSVEDSTRGKIYFLDHELAAEAKKPLSALPCLASSFSEFLGGIRDFDPNDPGSEELFHKLAERRRKDTERLEQILAPKKPWWKRW